MSTTQTGVRFTVRIDRDPGESPFMFPWSWSVAEVGNGGYRLRRDGVALTRWGARWAARRVCRHFARERLGDRQSETWIYTAEEAP